jgi:hypothetical protein
VKAPLVVAVTSPNYGATKFTTFVASLFVALVLAVIVYVGFILIKLDLFIARGIAVSLFCIGTLFLYLKADKENKADQVLFEKIKNRALVIDEHGIKVFRDFVSPSSLIMVTQWKNSPLLNNEGFFELAWSEIHSIATKIGSEKDGSLYYYLDTTKGAFLISQKTFVTHQSEIIERFRSHAKWLDSREKA